MQVNGELPEFLTSPPIVLNTPMPTTQFLTMKDPCSQFTMESSAFNWTRPHCKTLFLIDQAEFYRVCITLTVLYEEYLFTFIVDSLIVGLLCIFGAAGNILSVIVLSHDFSRTTRGANVFLRALCLSDTLFLVVIFFYSSLRHIYPFTGYLKSYYHLFPFFVPYLWAVAMTAQMATNWLVVMVTLERYMAVWRPFSGVQWQHASWARVACTVIACITLVYNIPRVFEWNVKQVPTIPCSNYTLYQAVDSWLRSNIIFSVVYRLILYTVLVAAGPLLALGFMNIRLIRALRRAGVDRIALTQRSPAAASLSITPTLSVTHVTPRDRNRNVTVCIIVIVSVFFVCETPALVHQVLASAGVHFSMRIQFYTVTLSNALVVVKSSANFFIYCLCGRKFRVLLCRLLRRQGIKKPHLPRSLISCLNSIRGSVTSFTNRTSLPSRFYEQPAHRTHE